MLPPYRRVAILLSLIIVLCSAFLVAPAHAMYDTANCGSGQRASGCIGTAVWSGNASGAETSVYVPSYTGSNTNILERFLAVTRVNGAGEIDVGYCFGASNTGYDGVECQNNNGNYFFVEKDNTNFVLFEYTWSIPSGDKTHNVRLGVNLRSNGVAGIIITGSSSNDCPYTTVTYSGCYADSQNYSAGFQANWLANYTESSFTGTRQGTFDWINNAWYNGNQQAFIYQSSSPVVYSVNGAQMYVRITPNGSSNNGGTITGCNKDHNQYNCL